ncbi:hypothetical protein N7537_008200 [Penicillium hordei]|uniref:Uncharacterized protein n=1 Tax=Penicillium hordei TaxID=40994 RepID=A0AAD6H050_9EURO|nr:uncharacterized protein N7537_008200 [Penicillium hordei]KAJ5598116.1 hypothetical protein N7537_008200 [Penicillium hordei]
MHLSTLLLLSASLASAQYGPSPEELEYLKNINGVDNDQNQNQNQGQNHNPDHNGNSGNYDAVYDGYGNLLSSPHTPIQAPPSSPTLIYSTFVARPSQAFVAPYQASAPGYEYNYPTPAASQPFATQSAYQAPAPAPQAPESNKDQSQYWPRSYEPLFDSEDEDEDVSAGASGGIAPTNPLKPDSQVAQPPLFTNSKHGKDEGNTFCMGRCFEDESEAQCAKPYSLYLDIGL